MKTNYLFKNSYTIGGYLEYNGKIPVSINERTVTFKMFQDFDRLIDLNIFIINQNNENQLKIYIHYDENIYSDGYYLDIRGDNYIIIKASNPRGVRYAIDALNNVVEVENDLYKIPIALIEDQPSFKIRGIIEGYYGEPWSFEERLDMVNFMNEFKLNTYMYAPKMDIYHREKWYELYPEDEFNKLKTIKDKLNEKDIDFYYCISPGHAKDIKDKFKYVGESDFNRLYNKLKQMISIGINHFGLLLDDIDYKLTGQNKEIFNRPGIAHAHICNKVNQFLKENLFSSSLVMCPTEYHQIGSSEYRDDLKKYLDKDIDIFWTGDNVCAEAITDNDASQTKAAFGKDLFIWDNFPVSDFTYGVREFIAPIQNRTVSLSKYASAYMINPSIHYYISKIAMITMAHYAWNSERYDSEKSFEIALRYFGDAFYEKGMNYFKFNYPSVLSYGNLKNEKKMVENKEYQEIKEYYQKVSKSAKDLLTIDIPLIKELNPWLKRVIKEEEIILKIINNDISKIDLIEFLDDFKFSGSELLDYLILEKNILDVDEYTKFIKRRRGSQYYRVFEYKRWPQK